MNNVVEKLLNGREDVLLNIDIQPDRSMLESLFFMQPESRKHEDLVELYSQDVTQRSMSNDRLLSMIWCRLEERVTSRMQLHCESARQREPKARSFSKVKGIVQSVGPQMFMQSW